MVALFGLFNKKGAFGAAAREELKAEVVMWKLCSVSGIVPVQGEVHCLNTSVQAVTNWLGPCGCI